MSVIDKANAEHGATVQKVQVIRSPLDEPTFANVVTFIAMFIVGSFGLSNFLSRLGVNLSFGECCLGIATLQVIVRLVKQ